MSMKWKHTLVFALAIFAIGGSVYAVVPLKTSAQQWSKASADAGECPAGVQAYDCMDNRAEIPTWHYQDGGSAPMPVGGVVANRIPIGNATATGFTTNANFQYDATNFAIQVPGLEGYTGHGLYISGDSSDKALLFLGATTDEHAFLQVGGNLSHVWSKDGSYQLPSSTAAACVACMRFNGTNLQFSENGSTWSNFGSGGGGSGTVTSIATDSTLIGGPITTTGTLGVNLGNANTWTAAQTFPAASIAESVVANLTSDLASKAPTASPSFTGTIGGSWTTLSTSTSSAASLNATSASSLAVNGPGGATATLASSGIVLNGNGNSSLTVGSSSSASPAVSINTSVPDGSSASGLDIVSAIGWTAGRLISAVAGEFTAFIVYGDGIMHLGSTSDAPKEAGDLSWNGTNFVGSTDGSTWNVTLGGGGTIGGSITSGQMAYGGATSNTITGTANATLDGSGNATFAGSVTTPTVESAGPITLTSSGGNLKWDGSVSYLSVPGSVMGIGTSSLTGAWSGLYIAGAITQIGSGGASAFEVTGTAILPGLDLTSTSGSSSGRWTETWSRRYAGVEQTVAGASSITLDPALGETMQITLATCPTTVSGAAGYPNEKIVTMWRQPASGSTCTPSGIASGTNGFSFASPGASFTATLGHMDSYTWEWDATSSKWREAARSLDLTE